MPDGQQNVNVTPGGGDDNRPEIGPARWSEYTGHSGPPWNNRPPWWEGAVVTIVWTICALVVIGFVLWGILFVFHDVVNTLPLPR